MRRKTTLKHTGDLPGNNGSKQSLHRFQKKMQESTRKRSESLTLEKRNISFYFHSSRTKKTSVAPAPMLEIHSRAHTNYNGVKTDPCNLNGIGVASRHRIIEPRYLKLSVKLIEPAVSSTGKLDMFPPVQVQILITSKCLLIFPCLSLHWGSLI